MNKCEFHDTLWVQLQTDIRDVKIITSKIYARQNKTSFAVAKLTGGIIVLCFVVTTLTTIFGPVIVSAMGLSH